MNGTGRQEDRAERAPQETPESWRGHVGRWALFWLIGAALWFPLTTPGYFELYMVGVAAAAIAATAMTVLRARGEARFSPDPRWLRHVWRLPWAVIRDTRVVLGAAWRRARGEKVRGVFRGARFDPGGDDDRATARRAVAEAAASLAPNTFSLGIDREEGVMALHQLVRDDGPPHPADPLELR